MLTIELFVGSLAEMHDKVRVAESERFRDAEKVRILVPKFNLLVAHVGLDDLVVRADDHLGLGEEKHMFLLKGGADEHGIIF